MEDKILEILNQLQVAINSYAPEAWKLLVMKQRIDGIISILDMIALILITLYIYNYIKKKISKESGISFLLVFGVAEFFIISLSIENTIIKIFLPQYAALEQIIRWIK